MAVVGMKAGMGRGMWAIAQDSVVRIYETGSSIGVAPCLAAPRQHLTNPRSLESQVLHRDGPALRDDLKSGGRR